MRNIEMQNACSNIFLRSVVHLSFNFIHQSGYDLDQKSKRIICRFSTELVGNSFFPLRDERQSGLFSEVYHDCS